MLKIKIIIAAVLCGFAFSGTVLAETTTTVPSGYIACAMDNGTCKIREGQSTTIYYGANSTFAKVPNKSGEVTCSPSGLNVPDPIQKVLKTCYITFSAATSPGGTGEIVDSLPSGYTSCATDTKTCDVDGSWMGYYGGDGKFAQIEGTGSFTCLSSSFHITDPANGVAKTCYVQAADTAATGTGTTVASVPSGYKTCATDGKTCSVSGNWDGYYGANGKFAQIKGIDSFTCLPGTFNINDPIFGVTKTCYVNSSAATAGETTETIVTSVPEGYEPCATDGKDCVVGGNWDGYYGADSSYAKISGVDSFTCLPSSFGIDDPLYGVTKTCYIKSTDSTAISTGVKTHSLPSGYSACATDGNTCARSGDWVGYYGVDDIYVQIAGSGSFICLPGTFDISDPKYGTQKTCHVRTGDAASLGNLCKWTSQSGSKYSAEVASQDQCSCKCSANMAEVCYFDEAQIRDFACLPGQHP